MTIRVYTKVVGDILHPGHVRFLKAARAIGDHLTVCVVPDDRVAAYKGRLPLLTLAERMEVIAACRWVDAVITNGPKIIDRDFMVRNGFNIYAFGTSSAVELAAKLADCADLPEQMIVQLPYSKGISSSEIKARLMQGKG